ncbi:MAG: hypothetical protein RJQ07_07985 [Pseudomonadales bacterium]
MLKDVLEPIPDDAELIVASQSCDVAQSGETEPVVEVMIATRISKLDGNNTYNKNPRKLHLSATRFSEENVQEKTYLEIQATDKLQIPKPRFFGKRPDDKTVVSSASVNSFSKWLAGRYDRPALPTTFNDALARSDPNSRKRKKYAKNASPFTSGIYVEISPNRELTQGEQYTVNLLGLIPPNLSEHADDVEKELKALAFLMAEAGMSVRTYARTEDQITIALLKNFQRLYFDDISFKNDDPLPPEVQSR